MSEQQPDALPGDEDFLLVPEVAAMARMSVDSFRYIRNQGRGPEGFRRGKRLLFRKGKVRAWLRDLEEKAQQNQGAA